MIIYSDMTQLPTPETHKFTKADLANQVETVSELPTEREYAMGTIVSIMVFTAFHDARDGSTGEWHYITNISGTVAGMHPTCRPDHPEDSVVVLPIDAMPLGDRWRNKAPLVLRPEVPVVVLGSDIGTAHGYILQRATHEAA